MAAIADDYGASEAAIRSLEAGSDVLLMPREPLRAIAAVVGAVRSGPAHARAHRGLRAAGSGVEGARRPARSGRGRPRRRPPARGNPVARVVRPWGRRTLHHPRAQRRRRRAARQSRDALRALGDLRQRQQPGRGARLRPRTRPGRARPPRADRLRHPPQRLRCARPPRRLRRGRDLLRLRPARRRRGFQRPARGGPPLPPPPRRRRPEIRARLVREPLPAHVGARGEDLPHRVGWGGRLAGGRCAGAPRRPDRGPPADLASAPSRARRWSRQRREPDSGSGGRAGAHRRARSAGHGRTRAAAVGGVARQRGDGWGFPRPRGPDHRSGHPGRRDARRGARRGTGRPGRPAARLRKPWTGQSGPRQRPGLRRRPGRRQGPGLRRSSGRPRRIRVCTISRRSPRSSPRRRG